MKIKEFKKLLKEKKEPQRIIGLYTNNKIFLTSKQVDIVLKLKNEVKNNVCGINV